ncbi:SDR family oxidoreductase [Natronomonas sp. F2-12]|jgi:NAD(P)-dependent dehydrogenase (short-subunit alcohol dehydrogenase family)|uniref:SDR family oxidoreductase n=1 Tax=Natronomonas aquatica TaxID=2841590 RepID=A0A9R1CQH7_9EURY|nr:SDR family oxidoreductase [Natronomonas aquatica]MCQ4331968.1 SDR family oxidoreductase [Natronomonas aquatica]
MSEIDLTGDVAVVTGGASGIGRRISLTLAEHGADVVVADLQSDPREGGDPTHERIDAEFEGTGRYVECDVTEPSELETAVEAAETLGGVSIMVNNAGISRSEDFLEIDEAAYDRMMEINAKGVFFGAQAAADRMIDAGREGSIVNLASISGVTGRATGVHYCASKGAVRVMTYAMAAALGPHDIRANAVCPGLIESPMTRQDLGMFGEDRGATDTYERTAPLGRVGQPQDIADAVLYLSSPLSGFVTGESVIVDGGATNTWSGVAEK